MYSPVSIHLMLLFIGAASASLSPIPCSFNTSHVVVYRRCMAAQPFRGCGFNTSHVVVYQYAQLTEEINKTVSIHLMLLFIRNEKRLWQSSLRFNTSHVVVYRKKANRILPVPTSFNTSHVVVYRCKTEQTLEYLTCFNTSHVVVYHRAGQNDRGAAVVSIHLMLLFIATAKPGPLILFRFNTSHVVVYPTISRYFSISLSLILLYFSSLSLFFTSRTIFLYIFHTNT